MELSRRSFVQLSGFTVLGLMCAGSLSACSSSSSDSAAKNQVIIAMSKNSEPSGGFDPCISWGCGEHVHEPLIQSTLINTDINLNFVNDLASEYHCSDDGMQWTFSIRDDVVFSDGEPLTANDVAFTINTIINSDSSQADLSMVRDAVALDENTVVLSMNKPNNALLYTLAVIGIVPEHAYGPDYGKNPIGSGRYVLEQWDQGQQAIFSVNPNYYGEQPKIERVVTLFTDEDAALAGCKSGDIDIAFTSALLADMVPSGYHIFDAKSVDSRGISLPCLPEGSANRVGMDGAEHAVGNNVTCDLAIRKAINLAVDRDTMISNVLNGYGAKAYSVADGMPWSSDDMVVDYDVEKARQYLSEGGWKAAEDGILVKDGIRAAFDLLYSTGDSVRQALAYEFANQMKAIGIEVNVKGGDWDTDLYPHQFDTPILWGWGSNSPVELYELSYSTGWGNVAVYDNDTIDAHLDAALAASTIEESYPHYKAAQWDEQTQTGVSPKGAATWVWLANIDHLYFARDGLVVAEQKPHPHGHGWSLANNVDQWSWEK